MISHQSGLSRCSALPDVLATGTQLVSLDLHNNSLGALPSAWADPSSIYTAAPLAYCDLSVNHIQVRQTEQRRMSEALAGRLRGTDRAEPCRAVSRPPLRQRATSVFSTSARTSLGGPHPATPRLLKAL